MIKSDDFFGGGEVDPKVIIGWDRGVHESQKLSDMIYEHSLSLPFTQHRHAHTHTHTPIHTQAHAYNYKLTPILTHI